MVYPMDPANPTQGGGVRHVLNLASRLVELGVPMTFIGVRQGFQKKERELPYRFLSVMHGTGNWLAFLLSLLVRGVPIALPNGTLVHTHRSYFLLPFIPFRKKFRFCVTLHGRTLEILRTKRGTVNPFAKVLFRLVERFCLLHADAAIAVSEDTAEFFCKLYPFLRKKIYIIPTGVDLHDFRPLDRARARLRYELPQESKIVLFAGRLERIKDPLFLLEVFKLVARKRDDTLFLIAGEGAERQRLETAVSKSGLARTVLLTGELEPADMPYLLSSSDVLVIASQSESGPTVALEALACGVPVVSTHVGLLPELVRKVPEAGRVVPKDESGFAEAILGILAKDSTDKRTVTRRVRLVQRFDLQSIAEQVLEVYRTI